MTYWKVPSFKVVECHHPITVFVLSGLSSDLPAEKIAEHEDVYVFFYVGPVWVLSMRLSSTQ
jgi:hypothetical protein